MKEGDPGTFAEGAALGEGGGERVPDAPGQMVEAGVGVGPPRGDAPVEAVEAAQAEGSGDQREDKEEEFLGKGKHRATLRSGLLRFRSG